MASYYLECVDRVMKVLDCFTSERPELRLVDIARQLDIHKSQVLRIVSTLESGGYLIRNPETKRYRLGLQLYHLGMLVTEKMNVRDMARPYLDHLVNETGETARLVVFDGISAVCIDVVESVRGVRVYAQLGARMPWNAGSSGKVIFAHLPESIQSTVLANTELQSFTERTITDPAALLQEAAEIQRRGFHWSYGDLTHGARGLAAPLFDRHGVIVGAISITAPDSRLDEVTVENMTELVTDAVAEISRCLVHRSY